MKAAYKSSLYLSSLLVAIVIITAAKGVGQVHLSVVSWSHHGSPAPLCMFALPVCFPRVPSAVCSVCLHVGMVCCQPGGSYLQSTPFKSPGIPTAGCQIVWSVSVVVRTMAPQYIFCCRYNLWLACVCLPVDSACTLSHLLCSLPSEYA